MNFEGKYTWMDRLVHRIAFATSTAQIALSDFENKMFKDELKAITVEKPVFITGLPRAGTTLLLEVCSSLGEFATHSYRHMPFVLLPMLWRKFSKRHWQQAQSMERAHGDGMQVSVDSPESFEEMVWRPFWRKQYLAHRISTWAHERDDEFEAFFRDHVKKIIALGKRDRPDSHRYISKNNLNIARLHAVRAVFPDAVLVVPFRHPVQHAISLLRQHENFLTLHAKDKFAKRYMAAVGHYDLGANLRPIDFDGWLPKGWERSSAQLPDTKLEFWLKYWTASYAHLLEHGRDVQFVCYESLCENPAGTLGALSERLAIRDPGALLRQGERIKVSAPRVGEEGLDRRILEAPMDVYQALCRSERCAVAPRSAMSA